MEPSGTPESDSEAAESQPGPELGFHEQKLIAARNHLVQASQAARLWAEENPAHPVSYLLTRSDIGEQTKIQSLRRIETVSLPAQVNELLDAARYFNECQAAAESAFETERTSGQGDLPEEVEREIFEGLRAAYLNLLRGYRNWGGFGYHGWPSKKDPESYSGPAIWTRQDCVFRFGKALEREFPDRVHVGLKISKLTSSTFDPEVDRGKSIDITVTVPGLFTRDLDRQRFRKLRHDLFVEVEWLKKGRWMNTDQLLRRCGRIQQQLIDLQRSMDRGRCEFAAMLIVDDEGFLDYHDDLLKWPPDVIALVVSPATIQEEGLGNGDIDSVLVEIDRLHDLSCPCSEAPLTIGR